MNARFKPLPGLSVSLPATEDIWSFVQQLLSSPTFAKAPRMCRLLTFLLEKKLSGLEHEINEYAIGLDVFDRDAGQYDTTLDPSVRVHVGRLRTRLGAYYADLAETPAMLITIPLGGYVPVVTQNSAATDPVRKNVMQVAPLRNLTAAKMADAFVCGLDEELGSHLYRVLGSGIQLGGLGEDGLPGEQYGSAPLRLEGSVRVEENHVRASMRLVEAGAGQVTWLSQFDRHGQLCMSLQEELAAAICDELQDYLKGHVTGDTYIYSALRAS